MPRKIVDLKSQSCLPSIYEDVFKVGHVIRVLVIFRLHIYVSNLAGLLLGPMVFIFKCHITVHAYTHNKSMQYSRIRG